MIRNDLKPLLGDGWKSKFVHRDLWDPDGYGVASFDLGEEREKVLAINFATEDIMEYFYEDRPDDEWISLDLCKSLNREYSSILPTFSINKNYKISGKTIRNIRKVTNKRDEYPQISFGRRLLGGEDTKLKISAHIIIAKMFVPNPDPSIYSIVNHKDCNRLNFEKENLEWCDYRWNSLGQNQQERKSNSYIEEYDLNWNFMRIWEYRDLYRVHNKPNLCKAIKEGRPYRGSYWKRVNKSVAEYLEKHPINPSGWYTYNKIPGVTIEVNTCGVLRINNRLTVGYKDARKLIYDLKYENKHYYIHRIVYEAVSGSEIPKGMVIDHIIPSSSNDINNEFSNLRLTTYSGNMNNPETRKNLSKEVYLYDLFGNLVRIFDSVGIASDFLGTTRSAITTSNRRLYTCGGLICIINNDEGILKKILEKIYYRVDPNNNTITPDIEFKHIVIKKSVDSHYKKHHLNTGNKAPDGNYYYRGYNNLPEEVKNKIKKNLED